MAAVLEARANKGPSLEKIPTTRDQSSDGIPSRQSRVNPNKNDSFWGRSHAESRLGSGLCRAIADVVKEIFVIQL